MEKTMIIGNLCNKPELKTTQNGVNVCTFTVAVNSNYTKQDGSKDVTFYRVTAWRSLGDVCAKYLDKGRKVFVSGSVKANGYINKNGEAAAALELTANEVEFLSSAQNKTAEAEFTDAPEISDEDIPF